MDELEEEIPPVEYGENLNHDELFKDAFTDLNQVAESPVPLPDLESHKNQTMEKLSSQKKQTFTQLTSTASKLETCQAFMDLMILKKDRKVNLIQEPLTRKFDNKAF